MADTLPVIPPEQLAAYVSGSKIIKAISSSISKCLEIALTQAFSSESFRNSADNGALPYLTSLLLLDFSGKPFNRIEMQKVVEALGVAFSAEIADTIGAFHFGSHFIRIALSAFLDSSGVDSIPDSMTRLEMSIGISPNSAVSAEAIDIYKKAGGQDPNVLSNQDAVSDQIALMLDLAYKLSEMVQVELDYSLKSYLCTIPKSDQNERSILAHFFASVVLMFAGSDIIDKDKFLKLLSGAGINLDNSLMPFVKEQMGKNYLICIASAFTLLAAGKRADEGSMLRMLRALSVHPNMGTIKYTLSLVNRQVSQQK